MPKSEAGLLTYCDLKHKTGREWARQLSERESSVSRKENANREHVFLQQF